MAPPNGRLDGRGRDWRPASGGRERDEGLDRPVEALKGRPAGAGRPSRLLTLHKFAAADGRPRARESQAPGLDRGRGLSRRAGAARRPCGGRSLAAAAKENLSGGLGEARRKGGPAGAGRPPRP